jgi:hypothetical protein
VALAARPQTHFPLPSSHHFSNSPNRPSLYGLDGLEDAPPWRADRGRGPLPLQGEVHEQVDVAAEHDRAGEQVGGRVVAHWPSRCLPEDVLGDVLEVPAGEADEGAEEHLADLREGDEEGGEGLGAQVERQQAVVAVHECVDHVVHGHEVQARPRHRGVRVPAEQQHRHVVVPVQEDQRLLAQHDEGRVHQLGQLREDEQHHPEARGPVRPAQRALHPGPDRRRRADRLLVVHGQDVGHEARHGAPHADEGEHAQHRVPDGEGHAQVEGPPRGHDVRPREAEQHVDRDDGHGEAHIGPREGYVRGQLEAALERQRQEIRGRQQNTRNISVVHGVRGISSYFTM